MYIHTLLHYVVKRTLFLCCYRARWKLATALGWGMWKCGGMSGLGLKKGRGSVLTPGTPVASVVNPLEYCIADCSFQSVVLGLRSLQYYWLLFRDFYAGTWFELHGACHCPLSPWFNSGSQQPAAGWAGCFCNHSVHICTLLYTTDTDLTYAFNLQFEHFLLLLYRYDWNCSIINTSWVHRRSDPSSVD
jgi:hypothetical protein